MHPNLHCSTVYDSQDMEATLMSIDRGMDKEDMCVRVCARAHAHNEILFSP